jgi:formamidase
LDRRPDQDNDNANDVRDVDLTKVHYLSGPIGVKAPSPGDLLVVDILDIGVLPEFRLGFHRHLLEGRTAAAFSPDTSLKRARRCWDFSGLFTESRHIFRAWNLPASCTRG